MFDALLIRLLWVVSEGGEFHGATHEISPVVVEDFVEKTKQARLEVGRRTLQGDSIKNYIAFDSCMRNINEWPPHPTLWNPMKAHTQSLTKMNASKLRSGRFKLPLRNRVKRKYTDRVAKEMRESDEIRGSCARAHRSADDTTLRLRRFLATEWCDRISLMSTHIIAAINRPESRKIFDWTTLFSSSPRFASISRDSILVT